ncbi:MAG TPA: hypothetical protein VMU51_34165 [Mycobacteriales bacterium]|nr:hypothetical protein [Mycobacteriales bacterium]
MGGDLDAREAVFLRELRLEQAARPPAPWRSYDAAAGRRRRAELAAALHLVDDYEPTTEAAGPAAGAPQRPGSRGLRVVS